MERLGPGAATIVDSADEARVLCVVYGGIRGGYPSVQFMCTPAARTCAVAVVRALRAVLDQTRPQPLRTQVPRLCGKDERFMALLGYERDTTKPYSVAADELTATFIRRPPRPQLVKGSP